MRGLFLPLVAERRRKRHEGIAERCRRVFALMRRRFSTRHWRPRTLPGLVAWGCILTALPVLAALLWAGIALDQLSRRSDTLVSEGLAAMHQSIDLRDRLGALERNSRQYLALQEPALLDLVRQRWNDVQTVLDDLQHRRVDPALTAKFQFMEQQLNQARSAWLADTDRAAAVERIAALEPVSADIITIGREAIDHRVDDLHSSAQTANHVMFLATLLLIPLTVLLTYGFSRAVAKPLRELSTSIDKLGHASYGHTIRIPFPREMQRLAAKLDWLRGRLAQLEADKDRFLRHVSHELKTPLASISEGVQLLSEGTLGPLNARQREVGQILSEASAELESSIGTLLAYAEWRAERQQLDADWFDPTSLVEEILASHRLPMERRRLRVEVLMREPLFGQRPRLRAALDNMVTNAIKHAPEASVIEISASAANAHCELSVRDYGEGVPDREKEIIFEPFVRGSAALENGIRGTGVGLSIVKETALAHNGKVYVEDATPGARFRLAWPCPPPGV